MAHSADEVGGLFGKLSLDGRPVLVRQWPSDECTDELESALRKLDPGYSPDVTEWKGYETKMPIIAKILNDDEHWR